MKKKCLNQTLDTRYLDTSNIFTFISSIFGECIIYALLYGYLFPTIFKNIYIQAALFQPGLDTRGALWESRRRSKSY